MIEKIQKLLKNKEAMLELVRYVFAGGLTTLLSIIISYGVYMLLAADHTINGANAVQVMIGNTVSWIICVLFAFWINRKMVFRVQGGTRRSIGLELLAFAGARLISWALFEVGLAALLSLAGMSNVFNRLLVLVLVTVFNYVASKFWIFKPKADAAERAPADQA
ncbi:MAG: GtrA family protein [Candidatus Limiplasma sp.]|nr:GtrA family protein [Candidatus Limiplasma sp.]